MKHFFKDFFIYGVASVISKIAAVFLMPIYTNILTREEYGAMALILSCNGIIDLFSNLNIHSGIARDYYEKDINRKHLLSTGFFSILAFAFSVLTLMLITSKFWTNQVLGISQYYSPFIVMLLSIPAGSIMSYFSILTRFKRTPILYSIGTLLQIIVQISISVYGVIFLRAGIISIFIGILLGQLVAVFFFWLVNMEYIGFYFDKKYLKRALLFSLPTLPAILAGWVDTSMGQMIIGKYISMEDLGVYSVALQLASIFTLLSTAFQNVWSPYLYENYKSPNFNKDINKLFIFIVLILISVSSVLSLLSDKIILILSNPSYIKASIYFILLCIPMCIYLLFPFAISGISISRDTKYIGISYIIGSIINIVILFVSIKEWGVVSVPIALTFSRIITFISLYKISENKTKLSLPVSIIFLLTFVVIVCFLLLFFQISIYARVAFAFIINCIIFLYILYKKNFIIMKYK